MQSPPQPFKRFFRFGSLVFLSDATHPSPHPPRGGSAPSPQGEGFSEFPRFLPFIVETREFEIRKESAPRLASPVQGEVAAAGSREGCDFLILFKLEPTLQSLVAFQSIGVRRTVWARDLAARATGFAINLSVAAGAIGHLGAIYIPFAVAIIAGFKAIAVGSPSYAAANTAFVNAFSITQRARVLAFAVASTTLKVLFSIAIRASNLLGVTTNCAIINTGCEQKQHTKCHC